MDQFKHDVKQASRKRKMQGRAGDIITLALLIILAIYLTFGKML